MATAVRERRRAHAGTTDCEHSGTAPSPVPHRPNSLTHGALTVRHVNEIPRKEWTGFIVKKLLFFAKKDLIVTKLLFFAKKKCSEK